MFIVALFIITQPINTLGDHNKKIDKQWYGHYLAINKNKIEIHKSKHQAYCMKPLASLHLHKNLEKWDKCIQQNTIQQKSFPDSSLGKESACNAGDPSSIPGSGRSAGEGTGYPLQYSWASHVAQLVKTLSTMRETQFRSLGWEGPLEKGTFYPLQYSDLENSVDCIVHGVAKSRTLTEQLSLSHSITPDLPLEKPVCRSGSNSQNWTWNNRLVPNRKRSTSRLYIVTLLI